MKKLSFLLLLFCFIICKAQLKYGGYTTYKISEPNRVIDSVGMDQTWYVSDYKTVPVTGLFIDTVINKSNKYNPYLIEIRVFIDRKIVTSFMFTTSDERMFWSFDIDKSYFIRKSNH